MKRFFAIVTLCLAPCSCAGLGAPTVEAVGTVARVADLLELVALVVQDGVLTLEEALQLNAVLVDFLEALGASNAGP